MTIAHCGRVLAAHVEAIWVAHQVAAQGSLLVVAVDGRSGSGKSTVVAEAAALLTSTVGQRPVPTIVVIDGDEFYAGGSAATWDERTAEQKVAGGIDWRRQREVLTALRETGSASWRAFDWNSDDWDSDDAPLAGELRSVTVAGDTVVLIDGAYSARPELTDLVDIRVLIQAPEASRRRRLQRREGVDYESDWTGRWASAEELYFGSIVPADDFDLIVANE